MNDAPLILTLALQAGDQARFDRLRALHFPPDRNMLQAHVTLFHHLPGTERETVQRGLELACAAVPPFSVAVQGLRFLGRGVAYALEAPVLTRLRADLARQWHNWLTPQDRQGYRPHVTIQNKASAETARDLYAGMQAGFAPFTIRAEGLSLWRYLGGPWEAVSQHRFAG